MVTLIATAVELLMATSKSVRNSAGRWAGLAPFRMRVAAPEHAESGSYLSDHVTM
jgi:hypothetical protein